MPFDVGSVVAHVKADLTNFEQGIGKAKQEVSGLKDHLGNLSSGIKDFADKASIMSAVVVTAFGAFAIKAGFSAARVEELGFALTAVAKANNIAQVTVDNTVSSLRKFNIANDKALEITTLFIQSQLDLTDALKLANVAKDLAVISGQDSSQATKTLTEAIAAQEPMLLRQFGLVTTMPQIFEKYAAATGKSAEALTENEKKQATLNYILQEGEKVAGTYDAAMESVGKRFRSLTGRILPDFMAQIGEVFKPEMVFIIDGMANGIKELGGWFEANKDALMQFSNQLVGMLKGFADWVINNKEIVLTFLTGVAIGVGAILMLAPLLVLAMHPFILIFAAIAIAVGLLYTAWQTNFFGIRDITMQVITYFMEVILPKINEFITWWKTEWDFLAVRYKATWDIIWGIVQVAFAIIYAYINTMLKLVRGDWQGAWDGIKWAMQIAWDGIKNIFNGAVDFIKGWGGQIIAELTRPFQDAWNRINDYINKIKDALDFTKKHSPSVVDIVTRGVNLVNRAMEGLEWNTTITPHAAVAIGANGAAGGTMVNQITVNLDGAMISDEAGATRIAEIVGNNIIKKLQYNVRF